MKVGVTGTRQGMTEAQKTSLAELFRTWLPPDELHHGDCVGADVQAAAVALEVNPKCKVVAHPPDRDTYRGFFDRNAETLPVREYLTRNRDVTDACAALVVLPKESKEQKRGGTWYTHAYAVRRKKRVVVVWPDGSVLLR